MTKKKRNVCEAVFCLDVGSVLEILPLDTVLKIGTLLLSFGGSELRGTAEGVEKQASRSRAFCGWWRAEASPGLCAPFVQTKGEGSRQRTAADLEAGADASGCVRPPWAQWVCAQAVAGGYGLGFVHINL